MSRSGQVVRDWIIGAGGSIVHTLCVDRGWQAATGCLNMRVYHDAERRRHVHTLSMGTRKIGAAWAVPS